MKKGLIKEILGLSSLTLKSWVVEAKSKNKIAKDLPFELPRCALGQNSLFLKLKKGQNSIYALTNEYLADVCYRIGYQWK